MLRKLCIALILAAAWGMPAAAGDGDGRFRLGPFFEWRDDGTEMTYLAVRPFFAWQAGAVAPEDRDMEVLWPLTHFGWRRENAFHWRVIMSFWRDADRQDPDSDWEFSLPPLWVNGHDRTAGGGYWGFFPFYGRLPRFIFLEDFRWAAFPAYLSYRTGGPRAIRRRYFLWPIVSAKDDPDKTRWAVWPIFGTKREPGFSSRFVLWPFWNDYTFDAANHHGTGWMLWPLMSRVNTDTEQGYGFIPPFFSYTKTASGAVAYKCPWPLFERYRDPKESTWRSWRFWGITHRGTRDAWWFLYPIMRHHRQRTPNVRKSYTHFWPFYTNESVYDVGRDGSTRVESSYFRIWPFWSSRYDEDEGWSGRALELFPFRDFPVVERNLTPFWTFYSSHQKPGERVVEHELFWGLISWETDDDPYSERSAPEENE